MNVIFFFILLAFSADGFAFNWKKVAENNVGLYYVDINSIKKQDGLVYYTDLVDFRESFNNDYSAISRYAVDCEREKQKWLSLTTFSKRMGKGIINSRSKPDEVIYPQSNTIYFFIIKNVCLAKR